MQKVIACIDGSLISDSVCDAAAWAASILQAPLTLLHTVEKPQLSESDLSGTIGVDTRDALMLALADLDAKRNKLAIEHGKEILAVAKQRALDDGAAQVELLQRHGDVLDALEENADRIRLIVMGRHGTSGSVSNHIGSHAERTTRVRQEPILLTVGDFTPPRNFMLAYDGRSTSVNALKRVAESPLLQGLPCHIVSVGEENVTNNARLADAKQFMLDFGFEVTAELIPGNIFNVLNTYKNHQGIELLVMGAYGHSA
ncbi:MAG TPA: universal stress protein, partial [Pseudomonadales bacterium]|nr:universal stress protein [Pseudomonadales bacterium]